MCDIDDAVDFDCSAELDAEKRHDVMRHAGLMKQFVSAMVLDTKLESNIRECMPLLFYRQG